MSEERKATIYFNSETKEIVRFVMYIDGKNVFQYVYYGFRPNWWIRLNMWLSGYTAEWVDEETS